MTLILIIGWPTLIILTVVIVQKGRSFYSKLKGNVIGNLIVPTIFGWLYGMYALGIVATAYMFNWPWYMTVIPAFGAFMVAIIAVTRTISKWEKEATDLKQFYDDLEKLVEKRTAELEEAHEQQISHEKEIQKLKDQFVFIAAHELRTPVTSISWALENAISEGKDKLDPDVLESLESVESSNKRLIDLVDDLLNVARIESGTIKVQVEKFMVKRSVNATLNEMRGVFGEKEIKVVYEPEQDYQVLADPNRYKQILINLLSNATKYNNHGGKISISHEEKDGKLVTHIQDDGIGIKPEDQQKLFTKFGRVKDEQSEGVEGTGLGLFLCKEILEQMDGGIWMESEYGKGSTFSFSVPLT